MKTNCDKFVKYELNETAQIKNLM